MNLTPAYFAALILLIRTAGRPSALRALTLSQATIKALPGRKNPELAEIQDQSAQVAEQIVQLAESIYDKDWSDPDLLSLDPEVSAIHAGLLAAANV